jgi:short subunit fatty acids transporter
MRNSQNLAVIIKTFIVPKPYRVSSSNTVHTSNRNLAKTMLVDAKNTTKFNNIKEDYSPGILIIETLVMKKTTVLASFSPLRQETVPNNRTVDKYQSSSKSYNPETVNVKNPRKGKTKQPNYEHSKHIALKITITLVSILKLITKILGICVLMEKERIYK